MTEQIAPTQADRDAAADLYLALDGDEVTLSITAEAERHRRGDYDFSPAVLAFARHRIAAERTASAEPVAITVKDLEPWADYHGDLPDYDHPLRPVFEGGIQYAVALLAKTLGVEDWSICDGTEEFDGDLGGTLFNIVLEAMPKDADGDPIHPSELVAPPSADVAASAEPVGLLTHFTRMMKAAANYIEPCTYIARHPIDSGVGLCKWNTEFPMPDKHHAPEAAQRINKRRDEAFISDIIYMLDGPEQRAAMTTATTTTPPPSADVGELVEALRAAISALEDGSDLNEQICCSGHECGCRGSTNYDLLMHDLHVTLAKHVGELVGRKYRMGDRVTKTKGSSWTGLVVGFYSARHTPIGYAVESENEPGSVQIYPESALAKHGGAA